MIKSIQYATSRKRPRALLAAVAVCAILTGTPARAEDVDQMIRFVDLMQNFFSLMDSMYDAASNPEHAALIQMHSLEDTYKQMGSLRDMVPIYREVVEQSTNPVVRRLARMRLADALKETGQQAEAIKVLREAISETVAQANRQGAE